MQVSFLRAGRIESGFGDILPRHQVKRLGGEGARGKPSNAQLHNLDTLALDHHKADVDTLNFCHELFLGDSAGFRLLDELHRLIGIYWRRSRGAEAAGRTWR